MLESYKGREVSRGQKVACFWNLHLNVFSLQGNHGMNKNLILSHGNYITMQDVSFVVRKGGRERVLREKQKNIHAFVKGKFYSHLPNDEYVQSVIDLAGLKEAYYNPYTCDSFIDKETGEKITKCDMALLADKKVWYK